MSVFTVVLFLAGISFMQAQVEIQKGKPDKPGGGPPGNGQDETWAVQIPVESEMLGGMPENYIYENNGKDIFVNVEKKGWKTVGKGGTSGIYYMFIFKLVNPTDKYVAFNGVSLDMNVTVYPENGSHCVFPGTCGQNGSIPTCMECFLNQEHPYSMDVDYDHVYIKFWMYDYEIENMTVGETYQLGSNSNGDRIRIKMGYTPVNTCYREEPLYHNIICQKYAEDGPLNTWIEKTDENKWRIYVGNSTPVYLPVEESYCIEEKNRGWVSKTVKTLEARGDFSFQMVWIKNPSTQ